MTATVERPPACLHVPAGRVGSYRDDVCEVADRIGRTPEPEQALAIEALTAHDARGRFLTIEAGVEMPRQNGKSEAILLPVVLWSALTDPDAYLWTAHQLDTSNKLFAALTDEDRGLIPNCDWLRRRVRSISQENGAEAITFTNGSELAFRARSARRGRGLSGNTIVYDETLFLSAAETGASLPILATRSMWGNARAYYGSSAARADSEVLRALRARALAGDQTLTWVGWWARGSWREPGCKDPGCRHGVDAVGCALDDEERWAEASPLYLRRVSRAFLVTMRNTFASNPVEFGREFLGWQEDPSLTRAPVAASEWAARCDPGSRLADEQPRPPVFVPEVALEGTAASISVCGTREDGRAHLETVEHRPGTHWVAERLAELVRRWSGEVVMDSVGPVRVVLPDLQQLGIEPRLMTSGDVIAACALFVQDCTAPLDDAGHAPGPRHIGQEQLGTALAATVWREIGDGGRAFGRKASGVDISPSVSAAYAYWGWTTSEYAAVTVFSFADLDEDDDEQAGDGEPDGYACPDVTPYWEEV